MPPQYAQHTSVDDHEKLTKAMLREKELRRRVTHLRGCALTGIRSRPEADALWRIALAEEEPHIRRDAMKRDAPGGIGVGGVPLGGTGGLADPADLMGGGALGAVSADRKAKLAAVRKASASGHGQLGAVPSSVPPSTLLAPEESKACVALGLSGSQYVACKRMLVLAAARQMPAPLTPEQAVAELNVRLDERRSKLLHQHCVKAGWLGA